MNTPNPHVLTFQERNTMLVMEITQCLSANGPDIQRTIKTITDISDALRKYRPDLIPQIENHTEQSDPQAWQQPAPATDPYPYTPGERIKGPGGSEYTCGEIKEFAPEHIGVLLYPGENFTAHICVRDEHGETLTTSVVNIINHERDGLLEVSHMDTEEEAHYLTYWYKLPPTHEQTND
jgi:hypothetical protein